MPPFTLKARYVFPVAGDPIPDGTITVDGTNLVAVGSNRWQGEVLDLGNAAVLPGLVNAHTHLEFSDLTAPLGERGIGFVDWIRLTMARRSAQLEHENNSSMSSRESSPLQWGGVSSRSIRLGIEESIRGGVATLGEIAQPGCSVEAWRGVPLNATIFQECIAPTPQRVSAAIESAQAHLHAFTPSHLHACLGLCPHAPYSVHPELLSALATLSANRKVPLAMHLAESREEIELLRNGTGPLRLFLEEIEAWDAHSIRPGTRPMDYLKHLASVHRALVIHGGYLDDEEIALLGDRADRMSVVYCPRTHDWFARDAYPLEKMLAAGVVVALGTDGRGSSPDLSLWAEMRWAAERHPAVGREKILRMGTLDGARAMGWDRLTGSLEPGKQADIAIVSLPDCDSADPHALLFQPESTIVGRWFQGVQSCCKT